MSLLKPVFLHIPDGFLSLPVALIFWALSAALLALALRRSRGELFERQIPVMGVMAAFLFAAQMINFPVAGGTSGHLLGGALAAITLGPWAAMLVMTAVVGIQALVFQDGGFVVMGANIFNMGLVTALIGYGLYRAAAGRSRRTRLTVVGIAAWLSVLAGALFTAIQLWLSGTAALQVVVPAMLGVHTLIGLGEALITVAALSFIERTRPDLVQASASPRGGWGWVAGGVALSLFVVVLSPLASASPDGLMRVAQDLGFAQAQLPPAYQALPGYSIPVLGEGPLSRLAAGGIGVALLFGLVLWGMKRLRRPARD